MERLAKSNQAENQKHKTIQIIKSTLKPSQACISTKSWPPSPPWWPSQQPPAAPSSATSTPQTPPASQPRAAQTWTKLHGLDSDQRRQYYRDTTIRKRWPMRLQACCAWLSLAIRYWMDFELLRSRREGLQYQLRRPDWYYGYFEIGLLDWCSWYEFEWGVLCWLHLLKGEDWIDSSIWTDVPVHVRNMLIS